MKIEWNSYPISSISSICPIHILPHIEHQIFSTFSRHLIHRLIINTKIWKTNWKPPSFRQVSGNTCRRGGEGGASWRMRVNRGSTRTDKPSVSVSEIWKRPLDSYVKTGWYLSASRISCQDFVIPITRVIHVTGIHRAWSVSQITHIHLY